MSGPQIESELKLIADGEAPLRTLATRPTLGASRLGPPRTVEELDRYLDTADLRLASQGWACRLRTREGSTLVSLKGPARHETSELLHRRPELNGPATPAPNPAGWPPSEARAALEAMSGGEPLVERCALMQTRTERSVLMRDRRLGTLSLDRVRVVSAGVELGTLHIVELELDPAVDRDPNAGLLARELVRIDGLRPDPLTKVQHALRLIEAAVP